MGRLGSLAALVLAPLVLVASLPSLAAARDERAVVTELRALGPQARALWPGLGGAVDEAAALRRDLGPTPYDAREVFRRRYGRAVSPRASQVDRRLLSDALQALVVLERAAAARGDDGARYRATHDTLLRRLQEGLADAAREANQRPRRVESLHVQSRGYDEQLAALPSDAVTRVGLTPAVLLLLVSLAGDEGRAGADAPSARSASSSRWSRGVAPPSSAAAIPVELRRSWSGGPRGPRGGGPGPLPRAG